MPCAAASSSMPRMCAVFAIIGRSRRAANVAIETWSSWFADVGRLSTLAGCASDLFSRGQRRRRHVRDHEAAVEPRLGREERRQARHAGVDQHRDAALGDRADLGDRDRHRVGGQRDRLGVEVAARDQLAAVVREDQRVVGDGVGLAHAAPAPRGAAGRGRRRRPAAGSAGCTGPARGRRPSGASGGSRCRRAARGSTARTSICPGWPRSAWMRGSNGPSLPRAASTRQRADHQRRLEHRLERQQRVQGQRGRRPACR